MSFWGWSEEKVRRMNGAQGWVYFNYAKENEATIWGNTLERVGEGYVEQEYKKILSRKRKA